MEPLALAISVIVTIEDSESYNRRLYELETQQLKQLSSRLQDKKAAILGLASRLRGGIGCSIDVSTESLSRMMGGQHCHADIDFEDGTTWILRLSLIKPASPSLESRDHFLKCEVATLQFLEETRLPTPKVWHFSCETDTSNVMGFGYIMMQKLPGKPLDWQAVVDANKESAFLMQFADILIEIEKFPLPLIGSLVIPSPSLGALAQLNAIDGHQSLGPFTTFKEYCQALVKHRLSQIADGRLEHLAPIDAYLRHLWMSDFIDSMKSTNSDQHFYLKHSDDKGDHILVDDQFNITGIIDWEWAITTCKEYALAAPCAFWPVDKFYDSSNDLSTAENNLISILRKKQRDDLGDIVADGRKIQRLLHCLDQDGNTEPETSIALFRGLVNSTGQDTSQDDWWRDWRGQALSDYKMDSGLTRLLQEAS